MITVSIVIYKSSTNDLDALFLCLLKSSVKAIYMIDNSPTDQLRKYADLSPKITYSHGHGNIGYGAAHNIGIRKAIELKAKYHAVINPDIYFSEGTIEKLAEFMESNEDVGQVMPKVVYPNGELQYLCKLLPTPINLIGRRFGLFKKAIQARNNTYEMHFTNYDQIMDVPCLSGCFMFLRVDALKQIHGFDEKFWMYCEDVDLCRRIGMIYRTVFNPNIRVVHYHTKGSYVDKKLLIQHIKSAIIYFNKWGWFFDKYRQKTNKEVIDTYLK